MSATTATPVTIETARPPVPLSRLVKVELRKMFNTRSGFWLMMSIAITAGLATLAVIAFVDVGDLEYGVFGAALAVPTSILLPVVAILSVTSEWSQRTGLITFTLVPHRAQIVWAKVIAAVTMGVVSMVLVLAIGALGNIVGTSIRGGDIEWDVTAADLANIVLANVLGMLIGFMLGVLIRNSAGAVVGYFVYSFVIPTIFGVLAELQDWFDDIHGWVDFNFATAALYEGPSGEEWAQIGVSGVLWLVIPMAFGIWALMRSEVK